MNYKQLYELLQNQEIEQAKKLLLEQIIINDSKNKSTTKALIKLSKHIQNGGKIIIGTDHWEYYDWIVDELKQTNLKILSTNLNIIKTRYQLKNKAGTSAPKYFILSNN